MLAFGESISSVLTNKDLCNLITYMAIWVYGYHLRVGWQQVIFGRNTHKVFLASQ